MNQISKFRNPFRQLHWLPLFLIFNFAFLIEGKAFTGAYSFNTNGQFITDLGFWTNNYSLFAGFFAANGFSGAGVTNLNATNLTGTLQPAQFPSSLPAVSGISLTSLSAGNFVPGGAFPAENAANLTNLPAGQLTGTLPAISGASLTGVTDASALHFNNNLSDISNAGTARNNLGAAALAGSSSQDFNSRTNAAVYFIGNGGGLTNLPGGGSVTSVGLSLPAVLFNGSVPGSPVTSTGTLAPTLATQSANVILSGPGSGAAATPTFRSLGSNDVVSSGASYTNDSRAVSLTNAGNSFAGTFSGNGAGLTNLTVSPDTTVTYAQSTLALGGTGSTNVTLNAAYGGVSGVVQYFTNSYYLSLTTNAWFGQPSNLSAGQQFTVELAQDGTGNRTVNFNPTYWKFPAGVIGNATTNASATDVLSCVVNHAGTAVFIVQTFNLK